MTSFKFGRLAAQFPAALRDLTYYSAGPLPKPPASVAAPKLAYGMDGNDQYGDCGVAGANHGFMSAATDTGETETFPTEAEIVSYYLTYTGGQDSGVVLSDFLAYVKKTGWFGHEVAAYAPVSISDIKTLEFAVNAYGFAYAGIQVTSAMENAFTAGAPWTPEDFATPVIGGHCVPIVGYGTDYLYCVTWGRMQAISFSAWPFMAEEAWAVLMSEVVSKGENHGLSLAALQADLARLTV